MTPIKIQLRQNQCIIYSVLLPLNISVNKSTQSFLDKREIIIYRCIYINIRIYQYEKHSSLNLIYLISKYRFITS